MLESLSTEELEFVKAIEKYKQKEGKLFLSWTEVLKVLKGLGYRKVARRAEREKSQKGTGEGKERSKGKGKERQKQEGT